MRKDKRQINAVWEYCNRYGDVFRFAKIGSGKNSYIKTIAYLGNVIVFKKMQDKQKILKQEGLNNE